ncbi:MAG: MBL fold metallo-hydrolase [Saprospiraceae bacterium]
MKKTATILFLVIVFFSCAEEKIKSEVLPILPETYLQILGTAQDAGFPQINCQKACCKNLWNDKSLRKMVSCIGVVDQKLNQCFLFDATPDIKDQLNILQKNQYDLTGVFLTHAHMGHYTGLMHLGREAMGAQKVPVFAMPKMQTMLEENAPWSQLVKLENIKIQPLQNDSMTVLKNIKVTPLQVPHRDEFSETVGFKIFGKNKTALFIPDIDKWGKWKRNILDEIRRVDYAFLDGTFYQNGEIPGRDMSLIPHPFMEESMTLFDSLSEKEKSKVYFIHFNHTNPVLQKESEAKNEVEKKGFHIAREGQIFDL